MSPRDSLCPHGIGWVVHFMIACVPTICARRTLAAYCRRLRNQPWRLPCGRTVRLLPHECGRQAAVLPHSRRQECSPCSVRCRPQALPPVLWRHPGDGGTCWCLLPQSGLHTGVPIKGFGWEPCLERCLFFPRCQPGLMSAACRHMLRFSACG